MSLAAYSGLLPLLDIAAILLAAYLSDWIFPVRIDVAAGLQAGHWSGGYPVVVAALLGSMVLYDRMFFSLAGWQHVFALFRCHLTRYLLFAGWILVIGSASGTLRAVPLPAIAVWLALGFTLTLLVRGLISSGARRLARTGMMSEAVAVVGAGPLADRLIEQAHRTLPARMEVLGVYDDDCVPASGSHSAIRGTIDDLIESGKTRHIDWIFLNLPCASEQQVAAIVHRLKALSVPVAHCPWNLGVGPPYQVIDYIGDTVPVALLTTTASTRWLRIAQTACQFLPRWMTTFLLLPVTLVTSGRPRAPAERR
jgi:FlaA1/EpsC-like NDP-sugar epimerase